MELSRPLTALLSASLFGLLVATAQSQTPLGQAPPTFTLLPGNVCSLNWKHENGRVFFIQVSSDLISWMNAPLVDLGGGVPVPPYNLSGAGSRFYVRLRYNVATDQVAGAEGDLDGDGIPNLVEVAILGTDPFTATTPADLDNDGLPDAWETYYWGNRTTWAGGDDPDLDGLSNREEYELALNPTQNQAAAALERTDYVYDLTGRLTSAAAPTGAANKPDYFFNPDEEGNLLSAQ